jgi:hypothetical protein
MYMITPSHHKPVFNFSFPSFHSNPHWSPRLYCKASSTLLSSGLLHFQTALLLMVFW